MAMNLKYKEVQSEVNRISKLNDPKKALQEIINLDERMSQPKVQTRKRGNYCYFYEMEAFYDKEVKGKRARVIDKLGRMKIEDFEVNKDKIKELSIEELKDLLEQYKRK